MPRIIQVIKPKYIILDIDGTCAPISYFPNTMMPFLTNHARSYIGDNWDDPALKDCIERLRIEYERKIPPDLESRIRIPVFTGDNKVEILKAVYTSFVAQTDEGKKSATTMALAWLIWMDGCRNDQLKGEVFPDVPGALDSWTRDGVRVCTLSTMISLGQQMLFTCSNSGNLDELIHGYLCTKDIEYGKTSSKCYEKICERLACLPRDVLFFTDIGKEAVAAQLAGCRSLLIERPGNVKLQREFRDRYDVVSSFSHLSFVP